MIVNIIFDKQHCHLFVIVEKLTYSEDIGMDVLRILYWNWLVMQLVHKVALNVFEHVVYGQYAFEWIL